ncbi:hypothetical protein GDO81_020239 [Engystomops pustulosus]|uniref:Recombination activating protein 2 n=1 Tax=Engystomops pustulosus TaxID=76066 RepID=A0AAV6YUU5_ENGPU|nr:hypothetical protein GDO81_020239 [Engystomops pustulosus]
MAHSSHAPATQILKDRLPKPHKTGTLPVPLLSCEVDRYVVFSGQLHECCLGITTTLLDPTCRPALGVTEGFSFSIRGTIVSTLPKTCSGSK